jgi:5-carboxymethyl-2-hydroxymuconate isomerase
MPHCIVEITENLMPDIQPKVLMKDLAKAVFALGCFNEDDIKLRLYPVSQSFLGINDQEHAYVTAEVKVMDNKTEEQLDELASNVQNVLVKAFPKTIGKTSITTQVSFLDQRIYKRFKNFKPL